MPLLIGEYIDRLSGSTSSKSKNPFHRGSPKIRAPTTPSGTGTVSKISQTALNLIVLKLVVVISLLFLANVGWMAVLWTAGDRSVAMIRRSLFRSVVFREVSFFEQHRTGELMSRFSTDSDAVNQALTVELAEIIQRSVLVVGALSYTLYLAWDLTLISLALMPILGLLGSRMAIFFHKIARRSNDELSKATAVAQETIGSIKTVKSFAQEEFMCEKYDIHITETLRFLKKLKIAKAIQRYAHAQKLVSWVVQVLLTHKEYHANTNGPHNIRFF